MTDLLPCPFCGSPARDDLLPHAAGPGWVQCSSCDCDQRMSDTLEEAVARWNTRAPHPLHHAQCAVKPDLENMADRFVSVIQDGIAQGAGSKSISSMIINELLLLRIIAVDTAVPSTNSNTPGDQP